MEQWHSKSIVQEQSFQFALKVIAYVRRYQKDQVNRVLARQLLRSGTSIGANIEEALGGQSRKDFVAKLAIAAKEARETGYWLRLIKDTQPNDIPEITDLLTNCNGLLKILNSIILTSRKRENQTGERPTNTELRTQNSELPVP